MQLFDDLTTDRRRLGDEERTAFQGDQLRLVVTHIPPGHRQDAHRHERLIDATYVISGEVTAIEQADHGTDRAILTQGTFVIFEPGPHHTIENHSAQAALLLTVKCAHQADLTAEGFQHLCATDWYASPAVLR